MRAGTIIKVLIGIVVVAIIIYAFSGGETEEQYIQRIETERKDKDRFMRTSSDSPFKIDTVKYNGLKYFDPDPMYQITARFRPSETPGFLFIPTNDNKEIRYKTYGHANFELHGKSNSLLILELADGSENDGNLFIPFGDETSAETTYGAGRYLDIKHNPGDKLIKLDFNLAYNPYCAYSETFSCPLPPVENLLSIPIEAGEKTYE